MFILVLLVIALVVWSLQASWARLFQVWSLILVAPILVALVIMAGAWWLGHVIGPVLMALAGR